MADRQNRDRTGKRGHLLNSENPWRQLVLKHAIWRWERVKNNPELIQKLQVASKKRLEAVKPKLIAYKGCAEMAERQRRRCCTDKLGSLLTIDAESGACSYAELQTPCQSHGVCAWPTDLTACEKWKDGGPPVASLRCRDKGLLDTDPEESGDHSAESMDSEAAETNMRGAAAEASAASDGDEGAAPAEGEESDDAGETRMRMESEIEYSEHIELIEEDEDEADEVDLDGADSDHRGPEAFVESLVESPPLYHADV